MDKTLLKYAKTIYNTFTKYYKKYESIDGDPRGFVWIDNDNDDMICVMAISGERDLLKEYLNQRYNDKNRRV